MISYTPKYIPGNDPASNPVDVPAFVSSMSPERKAEMKASYDELMDQESQRDRTDADARCTARCTGCGWQWRAKDDSETCPQGCKGDTITFLGRMEAKATDELPPLYLSDADYTAELRNAGFECGGNRAGDLSCRERQLLSAQSVVANQAKRIERLESALTRLRDCDWTITPHDRMDAVREIARIALLNEDAL